jgi:hypothetical protein
MIRLSPCAALLAASVLAQTPRLPDEPIRIGTTPQFFVDDYMVDNRFAINYENESPEMVLRVFHQPKKYEKNPLWLDKDGGPAWVTVERDPKSGTFRMWYQAAHRRPNALGGDNEPDYETVIAYAESHDGIHWNRPRLGLVEWLGSKQNNAVFRGVTGRRATGAFLA